jgi:RNA polymerase sigma factor (TIGR02999 family)
MSTNQSAVLQDLFARWLQGQDEAARRQLVDGAYERLRRLAAVILNESFPRLKGTPALLQTSDVANETALAMYQALAEIRPATLPDFFRLAAQRIRWLLLDQAKRLDCARRHAHETGPLGEAYDGHADQDPPVLLEALYAAIDGLPENERAVVDMIYFHGLSQAETAALLGVTERTVRRHWTAARVKLYQGLENQMPLVPGSFLGD